jgi:hypothetical protein
MSCEKDSNVNCFSDEFSISHTISAMQVSNPADGAVFTNDSLMTIQWSVIGKWAYWFNIYLCDSSKPILCIANKFYSDNDRYPWLIPSTIPSGKYRIRVSNAEDSTDNGASGYFTIMRVPTGYTVVSPTAGSTYSGKCTVSWVNVGPVGNQIDIALWNDTSLVQTYGYKFSGNSGSYDCPIPVSLTQGDRYRMQLMAAADTTIWSFSDFFTIVPVPKTVSIAVSPYDTLKGGTYVTLNWSSTGIADAFSIASYFQIDLYDSTKVILKLWSNVGYTSSGGTWKVGKDLPTKSTYRIKMTSLVYPDIFAFTNYFTIVNN